MTASLSLCRRSFSFSPSLLHLYFIISISQVSSRFVSSLVPVLVLVPPHLVWSLLALDLILSGRILSPWFRSLLSFPRDSSSLRSYFHFHFHVSYSSFPSLVLSLAQLPTWSLLLFISLPSHSFYMPWFFILVWILFIWFSPPRLSLVICIFAFFFRVLFVSYFGLSSLSLFSPLLLELVAMDAAMLCSRLCLSCVLTK